MDIYTVLSSLSLEVLALQVKVFLRALLIQVGIFEFTC